MMMMTLVGLLLSLTTTTVSSTDLLSTTLTPKRRQLADSLRAAATLQNRQASVLQTATTLRETLINGQLTQRRQLRQCTFQNVLLGNCSLQDYCTDLNDSAADGIDVKCIGDNVSAMWQQISSKAEQCVYSGHDITSFDASKYNSQTDVCFRVVSTETWNEGKPITHRFQVEFTRPKPGIYTEISSYEPCTQSDTGYCEVCATAQVDKQKCNTCRECPVSAPGNKLIDCSNISPLLKIKCDTADDNVLLIKYGEHTGTICTLPAVVEGTCDLNDFCTLLQATMEPAKVSCFGNVQGDWRFRVDFDEECFYDMDNPDEVSSTYNPLLFDPSTSYCMEHTIQINLRQGTPLTEQYNQVVTRPQDSQGSLRVVSDLKMCDKDFDYDFAGGVCTEECGDLFIADQKCTSGCETCPDNSVVLSCANLGKDLVKQCTGPDKSTFAVLAYFKELNAKKKNVSPEPANQNEESLPPEDTCKGKSTCEECAAENLNKETCYWENGICSQVPAGDDLATMCDPPIAPITLPEDTCTGKATCEECAAENAKVATCGWENGACSQLPAGIPILDKMCEAPSTLIEGTCDGKPTCEECLDGGACHWENGICNQVPAGVPNLNQICESPPASNPCVAAKTCHACQLANSEMNGNNEICLWGNQECKKVPKKDNPSVAEMCASKVSPCDAQGSCGDCRDATDQLKDGQVCVWENDGCFQDSEIKYPETATMCDEAPVDPSDAVDPSEQEAESPTDPTSSDGANCHSTKYSRFECQVEHEIKITQGSSHVSATVNCALDSEIGLDIRKSKDCFCSAVIKSALGDEKTCRCSICDGSGETPISINCGNRKDDPFVLGSCTTIDCANTCNGTCTQDCEGSETDTVFGQPHSKPNATTPDADQPARPILPGKRVTTKFRNIQITLAGVGPLDEMAIDTFERATAAWYNSVYLEKQVRRLVETNFTDFSTIVTFRNQSVTDSGNTISYDQDVKFVPTSETNSTEIAVTAQELLEESFDDPALSTEYAQLLQESGDESFVEVQGTDIQKPDVPVGEVSSDDVSSGEVPTLSPSQDKEVDDSSSSNSIWIVVAGVLGALFVLSALLIFVTRRCLRRGVKEVYPHRDAGPSLEDHGYSDDDDQSSHNGMIDYSFENECPEMTGPFIGNDESNISVSQSSKSYRDSNVYLSDEDDEQYM